MRSWGACSGKQSHPKIVHDDGDNAADGFIEWLGNVMGWESGPSAVEGDGKEGT